MLWSFPWKCFFTASCSLISIRLVSRRCGFSRMVPQRLLQIIHGSANTNFSKRPNLYSRWHSMASTFTWSCCMSLLPMGLLRFEIAAISLAMVEKVMLNYRERLQNCIQNDGKHLPDILFLNSLMATFFYANVDIKYLLSISYIFLLTS